MLNLERKDLKMLAVERVSRRYRAWVYAIFAELGLMAAIPFFILLFAYIDLPLWGTISLVIPLFALLLLHIRFLGRLKRAEKTEMTMLLSSVEDGIAYNS